MKEHYLPLGPRGHYGCYFDTEKNKICSELNKVVDEYNSKINSFDTEKENTAFCNEIEDKINKLTTKLT